jgi:hypothetical protein
MELILVANGRARRDPEAASQTAKKHEFMRIDKTR